MEERVEFLENELVKYAESFAEITHHYSILHNFLLNEFGSKFKRFLASEIQQQVEDNFDEEDDTEVGEKATQDFDDEETQEKLVDTFGSASALSLDADIDLGFEDELEKPAGQSPSDLLAVQIKPQEDNDNEEDGGENLENPEVEGTLQSDSIQVRAVARPQPQNGSAQKTRSQTQVQPQRVMELQTISQIKAAVRQTTQVTNQTRPPRVTRPPPPLIRRPPPGSLVLTRSNPNATSTSTSSSPSPTLSLQRVSPIRIRSKNFVGGATSSQNPIQAPSNSTQNQTHIIVKKPSIPAPRIRPSIPNLNLVLNTISTTNGAGNGNGKYSKFYRKVDSELIQCKVCKKVLKRRGKFVQHLRTHTGERPFHCEFCPATFSRKDNMNVHMQRHHPDANEGDNASGSSNNSNSNLNSNLNEEEDLGLGDETFTCQYCYVPFGTQASFASHLQLAHGVGLGLGDDDDLEEDGDGDDALVMDMGEEDQDDGDVDEEEEEEMDE